MDPKEARLTLGDLSESFGTTTWLENIVRKALDYPLAFLGKRAWLKSVPPGTSDNP